MPWVAIGRAVAGAARAVGGAAKAAGAVEGAAGAAESAAGAARMGSSTGDVLKGALKTISSGNNTSAPSNESRNSSAQLGASESGSSMFNTQTPF